MQKLKITMFILDNSAEHQRFLNDRHRETDAFKVLIAHKAHMAATSSEEPAEEETGSVTANSWRKELTDALKRTPQLTEGRAPTLQAYLACMPDQNKDVVGSTRKAGVQKSESEGAGTVICDVREFKSKVPNILDLRGLKTDVVTLEVGDYILTPQIAVERKAINDLVQSFQSGRLFTQMEAMCRHYEKPTLLVEFDANQPYCLLAQASVKIGPHISSTHIFSQVRAKRDKRSFTPRHTFSLYFRWHCSC